MTGSSQPVASLVGSGLSRSFSAGGEVTHALREVDITLWPGRLTGLIGPSGSGKSTLLNVLAGWERQDSGTVRYGWDASADASTLSWSQVAFVPQSLGLLAALTIRENVSWPVRLAGANDADVDDMLKRLGLAHLARRRPSEVSLGEQQRTAVARALVLRSRVILVDEPTSHQDGVSADRIFAALRQAADDGAAVLISTHDPAAVRELDARHDMTDGRLTSGGRA